MEISLKNKLFYLSCVTLVFTTIPKKIECGFLFGMMGGKLSAYFFLIGMIISFYFYIKKSTQIHIKNIFFYYIFAYFSVIFISQFVGLLNYPYYNEILKGPISQIEKFSTVYYVITEVIGIPLSQNSLLLIWMIIRPIKELVLTTIFTFGVSYIVYKWYKKDWDKGVYLLNKAIFVTVILICLYSIFECFYLLGNTFSENVLSLINPIIHQVKADGTWWPPLLWERQVRSVFAEPSYFGIYSAFAMPWLWYQFIKNKYKTKQYYLYLILIMFYTFLLFLTKARTAVVLFCGDLILFLFFAILFKEELLKRCLVIILSSVLIFFASNVFISFEADTKNSNGVTVVSYFEDNVESLASPDKRSNRARYSIMKANFKMGIDYPFIGVGYSLRQAYTKKYLPEVAFSDSEVKMWIHNQEVKGIMKASFPELGDYLVRFAETGVIGLIIFLIPALSLLYLQIKTIFRLSCLKEKLPYIFFMISFLGILASGIGDSLNVTYCYWILLGLGYAMVTDKMKPLNKIIK